MGNFGVPFTSETAREFGRRGNLKRWSPEARAAREHKFDDDYDATPAEEYIAKRLARVRKQLDRIDKMMMDEEEPQKLDRLASAQSRLSEQERILAGRPTPGALRPSSKGGSGRKSYALPAPQKPSESVKPTDNQ